MKQLIAILGLIFISKSSFGQLNEELWKYYLYEKQLSENKVKLIIVERGDIINLNMRADGKIQQIVLANSNKSYFGQDKFYYYGDTLNQVLGSREILVKTYENGLTKSITIDGYTEYLSYQFFTDNEFTNALDTINLLESRIKRFEAIKTELTKKLETEYEYVPKEVKSIHSTYKRKIKEAFENSEKLLILNESLTELNKFSAMNEKDLKKLNRELKKKYGVQKGFKW